jgi:hypothetical protein
MDELASLMYYKAEKLCFVLPLVHIHLTKVESLHAEGGCVAFLGQTRAGLHVHANARHTEGTQPAGFGAHGSDVRMRHMIAQLNQVSACIAGRKLTL